MINAVLTRIPQIRQVLQRVRHFHLQSRTITFEQESGRRCDNSIRSFISRRLQPDVIGVGRLNAELRRERPGEEDRAHRVADESIKVDAPAA